MDEPIDVESAFGRLASTTLRWITALPSGEELGVPPVGLALTSGGLVECHMFRDAEGQTEEAIVQAHYRDLRAGIESDRCAAVAVCRICLAGIAEEQTMKTCAVIRLEHRSGVARKSYYVREPSGRSSHPVWAFARSDVVEPEIVRTPQLGP